jgi:hypothetical protein
VISYHRGDATQPDLSGRVVIAARHPLAKSRFQDWSRGHSDTTARPFALGAIQWVGVGGDLGRRHRFSDRWVLNMVAQRGLRSEQNRRPLDLDALADCLDRLASDMDDEVIAMPRIGCGLAGGTWDEIEPLVGVALREADVHVYDL